MLKKENKISGRSAMVYKLLAVLLTLAVLISGMPLSASAAVTAPSSLDAPPHFGATFNYSTLKIYISASDSVRDYIARRVQDDPENRDLKGLVLYYQVDAKINNGSWQYTSEWDSPKTVPDNHRNKYYIGCLDGEYYAGLGYAYFKHLFSDETIAKAIEDAGWDYFKSNSITLRARFAQSFDHGNTYVLSPWSKEFTLSANAKADYNRLINHAPTLMSADVKVDGGGEPYFDVKQGKVPGEVQDLSSMSGNNVRTEIWMRRAGDKDFKYIHYEWSNIEALKIDASDYLGAGKQNYAAESYEIKVRYAMDLRRYPQSGHKDSTTAVDIYGPFSNVISHNMPAWSKASQWAAGDLKKADELGLIPDALRGADLTRPITRKEFAAVSVKLYEKLSGKMATPAAVNPFKDTQDQEVLKAYQVGITAGTAADEFSPDVLLNREQAAAMLTRLFKKTFVQSWTLKDDSKFTFNYTMPPKFADDAKISDWAKPSVYFMVSHGIISGVGGNNFAPKATTSAEQAANYASATREQALAISVRMTEKLDAEDAKEIVPAEPPVTPTTPPSSGSNSNTSEDWLIGRWLYSYAVGNVGLSIILEFKADGTFDKAMGSVAGYSYSATAFEGKYKVSNNKIHLYEQKKSTAYASSSSELWRMALSKVKDIPVEDEEIEYSKSEEGNLIFNNTEYQPMSE